MFCGLCALFLISYFALLTENKTQSFFTLSLSRRTFHRNQNTIFFIFLNLIAIEKNTTPLTQNTFFYF